MESSALIIHFTHVHSLSFDRNSNQQPYNLKPTCSKVFSWYMSIIMLGVFYRWRRKKKVLFSVLCAAPISLTHPLFSFPRSSLRLIYYRFSVFWLFCREAGWEDGTSSCSGCLGVLGVLARLPSRLAQPSGHALLWATAGGWLGCRGWAREATDALNDLAWWDSGGLGARLASKSKQFFSDMWATVGILSGFIEKATKQTWCEGQRWVVKRVVVSGRSMSLLYLHCPAIFS